MTKKDVKVENNMPKSDDTLSELLKEFQKVKNELENLKKEKKEYSREEQEAIEEAREEMLTDDEIGSLYIDEKYKEEGYFYRVVDSTRPGRVDQHIRRGYEVVSDPDISVGQSVVGKSSQLTSAVVIELGRNKGSCPGILMRIPVDKYKKRQEAKAKRVRELTDQLLGDMVDRSAFGEISIGDRVYKK